MHHCYVKDNVLVNVCKLQSHSWHQMNELLILEGTCGQLWMAHLGPAAKYLLFEDVDDHMYTKAIIECGEWKPLSMCSYEAWGSLTINFNTCAAYHSVVCSQTEHMPCCGRLRCMTTPVHQVSFILTLCLDPCSLGAHSSCLL